MSLGTLFVDLKADTGGFVSALSKAASSAQSAARKMSSEFESLQRVASQTFGAFGDFDPAISKITFALSAMGNAASRAMKELRGLPGAIGPIAALGAGATAGLAAATAGAAGMAIETAKSADEMYHMAESAGVSVETLSRLTFVGKQYDIQQESISRGLQMMAVQMVKAATAGPGVVTVFQRMGLDIRKSNGSLKDADTMFDQIIAKLEKMRSVGKTTEAMGFSREIFGRFAGGEFQRIDTSGLEQWGEVADRTGATITEKLGEASHELMTTLNTISAEAQGAANAMTASLLPSLQYLADLLQESTSDGKTWGQTLGEQFAAIMKLAVSVGDVMMVSFDQIGAVLEFVGHVALSTFELVGRTVFALGDVFTFDFSDAKKELSTGLDSFTSAFTDFWHESDQMWTDGVAFINGVWSNLKPPNMFMGMNVNQMMNWMKTYNPKGGDVDLRKPGMLGIPPVDKVADLVKMLNQQASAELSLAGNIQSTAAAEAMRKAAAEADNKILQERNQLLDQQRSLGAQVANAKKEQLPGDVTKYSQELANVRGYLKELDADVPLIRQRYQEIALAKTALSTGEELSIKETQGFQKQISSLQSMVAAYREGGSAIAAAGISKQLEDDRQKVEELKNSYALLAEQDPKNADALTKLIAAIDNANDSLAAHQTQLERIQSLSIDQQIAKETAAFREQLPALDAVNAAYLRGADAVREAQVGLKVADFKNANPGASAAQIAAITELYRDQATASQQSSIAQKAASYSISASYSDQVNELNKVKEALQAAGQSALLVDAAIDKAGDESMQKWDAAADQIGTMGERWRAFANEITLSADNTAGQFFDVFKKGVDDLSSTLAKAAVTGKANFADMFASIAEGLIKAEIQWSISKLFKPYAGTPGAPGANAPGGTPGIFSGPLGLGSSIAGVFGLKRGGGGLGKPSGTAADPIYVTLSSGLANLGGSSSSGNPLSFLFPSTGSSTGTSDGSSSSPFYSIMADDSGNPIGDGNPLSVIASSAGSAASSAGSFITGAGSSILGLLKFLPGFASGGRPTPGTPSIVGENGPELFVPDRAGTVMPNLPASRGNGPGSGDTHLHMNVYANDVNSFRQSQDQIHADMLRTLSIAHERNRR